MTSHSFDDNIEYEDNEELFKANSTLSTTMDIEMRKALVKVSTKTNENSNTSVKAKSKGKNKEKSKTHSNL